MKKDPIRSALLEIGVEELPARFVQPALDQLSKLVSSGLDESGVTYRKVEVYGTPRRLTVLIYGLIGKAEDRVDVAIGPPPQAAKDGNGEWTKAATGFAKAQNLSVKRLELEKTAKGERYVVRHQIKGKKTESVLKELYPAVIQKLNFPKSMIWEATGFRFARPIRWFVSLFNSKVINFRLAGVQADRTTYGLMALGPRKIPVPKPERYKPILQGRCILVDPEDRRKKILSQMDALAKKVKAKPVAEDDHLDEVVQLTEYPTSILGHFPESYLKLPREVLVSVMRKHQKFFPLETQKGQLTNAFVGVRNGPSEALEVVRDGYERVTMARLSDAEFFFSQDSKRPLEDYSARLTEMNFLEGQGTLLDKTNRVKSLVKKIGTHLQDKDGETLKINEMVVEKAAEAAYLAKSDLLTQMVGEFPELQGIAGRFYAQFQNKDSQVAEAIEQHYWPLTADGTLPPSVAGSLVSVCDKMESISFNIAVGHAPSGSADPHGLRRMALGLIRIFIENKWPLSIGEFTDMAVDDFGTWVSDKAPKLKTEVKEFFRQRCFGWFSNLGYRNDEIEAVLSMENDSLFVIAKKLQALKSVRGRSEFGSLAAAIKRAGNILKQAKGKNLLPGPEFSLDQNQMREESEKSLLAAVQEIQPRFQSFLQEKNFKDALLALAPLKQPVDAFFDGVMVMVDDENVRAQRLALLMSIDTLFHSMLDFSVLQATPDAK